MTTKKKKLTAPPQEIADSGKIAAQKPDAQPDQGFPIVGIGASAGGLVAFEAFFSAMPADVDSEMAFVLVQHLDPDHKSILAELISRYTRMQVFEAKDGMVVQPNCAYIIPPNRDMAFLNGALQLLEPRAPRGQRLPIDFFFRSLAQDQHEKAIGIVLSGTGSDGTLGVRAIKGEGGMVMAQLPESADYDGMPRSVIETGLADYVLLPAEMPEKIIEYVAHALGKKNLAVDSLLPKDEDTLSKIFILLRLQTGHDFSNYKANTINRRIARQMALHQIPRLEDYLSYLQQTPAEVEALFRELLIGVTSFFRDPDAFAVLQEIGIPQLFAGRSSGDKIRVWVPGCSTGEEAYSIAILLQEYMKTKQEQFEVQLFATDIDGKAIDKARAGFYPSNILADISPERLSRFFTLETESNVYRVSKVIRDMMLFSEHDLIKDPPFSKVDLISCRNLLIYFNGELQNRVFHLFNYALNPGGILFLGTSETVGESQKLFSTLNQRAKIYQRKEIVQVTSRDILKYLPPLTGNFTASRLAGYFPRDKKVPVREITERTLLKKHSPSSALVNERGDILYLHGRTGRYLEPTPGESGTSNILKMAREGLQVDLSLALHKAVTQKETVERRGLWVKTNGDFTAVNLTIQPIATNEFAVAGLNLFLVILEDAPAVASPSVDSTPSLEANGDRSPLEKDEWVVKLQEELKAKEEYLQSANKELGESNEQLKAANEEMQSMNEEMQSTNEELGTSKEELQSVNEELATVNGELQAKVAELSRVNNDMNNLLSVTGVGIVFVDQQLRIQSFTPAITQVINLIGTDIGRPIGHILTNLVGYDSLAADIQAVLGNLTPKEAEVQTKDGVWFILRIRPYRTVQNVIEGAVVSIIDISEMKSMEVKERNSKVK